MTIDTQEPDHLLIVEYAANRDLTGRSHTLETSAREITVGRAAGSDIHFDSDSISRRHARLERRSDGWWVVDAGSAHGTFVNERRVEQALLRPGDRVRFAGIYLRFFRADEPFGPEQPPPDPFDHNDVMRTIDAELQRVQSPGWSLALVRFAVDHYRAAREMHGDVAVDQAVRRAASLMRENIRPGDVLVRHCGEELELLLPGMDREGAAALADELRAKIAAERFTFGERTVAITFSRGVAQIGGDVQTSDALVGAVNRELLHAMMSVPEPPRAPRRLQEYRAHDDERPFLDRSHALGDADRLRYAQLIEARDPERAEWLRLEVALHSRAADDPAAIARFIELGRAIGMDFANLMLRNMIMNCGSHSLRTAPLRVRFAFACTKRWQTLAPTGAEAVRFCQQCDEHVYHCDTTEEAATRARAGQCISIPKALSDGGIECEMMGRPDPVAIWAEHLFPADGLVRRR